MIADKKKPFPKLLPRSPAQRPHPAPPQTLYASPAHSPWLASDSFSLSCQPPPGTP